MLSAVEQSSHVCSLPPGHVNHQHTCQSEQAETEWLKPQGMHWDRGPTAWNKKVRTQRSSEEFKRKCVFVAARNLGDIHKCVGLIRILITTELQKHD